NVNFVNCKIGFYQDPAPQAGGGEYAQNMYVDKTVFYQSQFINCGTAFSMIATRANNLNAWVNCVFDGNGIAIDNNNANGIYVANSIFRNHTGSAVCSGNAATSFYSCDFNNNSVTNIFNKTVVYAEGCNFNDDTNFISGIGKII